MCTRGDGGGVLLPPFISTSSVEFFPDSDSDSDSSDSSVVTGAVSFLSTFDDTASLLFFLTAFVIMDSVSDGSLAFESSSTSMYSEGAAGLEVGDTGALGSSGRSISASSASGRWLQHSDANMVPLKQQKNGLVNTNAPAWNPRKLRLLEPPFNRYSGTRVGSPCRSSRWCSSYSSDHSKHHEPGTDGRVYASCSVPSSYSFTTSRRGFPTPTQRANRVASVGRRYATSLRPKPSPATNV